MKNPEFENTCFKKKGKRADSISGLNKTTSKTFEICSTDSETVFNLPSYLAPRPDNESKVTGRRRKASKSAYCQELEDCQKEIGKLKVKLLRMKGGQSDEESRDYWMNYEETPSKSSEQESLIESALRLRLRQHKEDIKKEIMQELAENKEKEVKDVEDFYLNEIKTIEREQEAKMTAKAVQIKAEFDRNLIRIQEENSALKKQNETLKTQLEDALAKNGVRREVKLEQSSIEREMHELKDKYFELQRDYLKIRKQEDVLCSKCKAFTKVDQELAGKMENLKRFLNKIND